MEKMMNETMNNQNTEVLTVPADTKRRILCSALDIPNGIATAVNGFC